MPAANHHGLMLAGSAGALIAAWYFRENIAGFIHNAAPGSGLDTLARSVADAAVIDAVKETTGTAPKPTSNPFSTCLVANGYPGPKWQNLDDVTRLFDQCGGVISKTPSPTSPPPVAPKAPAPVVYTAPAPLAAPAGSVYTGRQATQTDLLEGRFTAPSSTPAPQPLTAPAPASPKASVLTTPTAAVQVTAPVVPPPAVTPPSAPAPTSPNRNLLTVAPVIDDLERDWSKFVPGVNMRLNGITDTAGAWLDQATGLVSSHPRETAIVGALLASFVMLSALGGRR